MANTNKATKSLVKMLAKDILINRELSEDDDRTDSFMVHMYVSDLNGKIHILSEEKVKTVRTSMKYWKKRQDTDRGKKFYSNMLYLYKQLLLCMEGRKEINNA